MTSKKTRPASTTGRTTTLTTRRRYSTKPSRKQRLLAFKERAVRALLAHRKPSRSAGGGVDNLKVHPAADWLPLLPDSEYQELRDDIKKRGLREPILVKHGHIADGRHRYRACRELGIEPTIEEYKGTDIIAEIASRNLFRRNLTPKQRAELVVKMCGEQLAKEAHESKTASLKRGDQAPVSTKVVRTGRTAETVARIAKVSRRTAEAALHPKHEAKPRKPKPQVDKLKSEYVHKRFGMFLKHWSHEQQRAVRKMVLEWVTAKP